MKKYVMYHDSLCGWCVTTAENYNAFISDARSTYKLGGDFEEAKAIVEHNFGLSDTEIIG